MQSSYHRRKFRLLLPALQLRLMVAFGGIALLALGLQFLLFYRALGEAALSMGGADARVVEQLASNLVTTLLISVGVLLPAVGAIGTSVVLRFVGPIFRFEKYLTEVLAGRDPGPLRLRPGDDLKVLCELIDRVAQPMREGRTSSDTTGVETPSERAA